MQIIRGISLASLFVLVSTGTYIRAQAPVDTGPDHSQGVLVMAHGGLPEWDNGVLTMLEPLDQRYILETALGMADAASLQQAVARLEHRGATDIAVVRLFISGESWYERTQQILGLKAGAPPRPIHTDETHALHDEHGVAQENEHAGHSMEFWRIETNARFTLSTEGLAEAPEMVEVLRDRVRTLSTDPAHEDILVLAHGPADDDENERWLRAINERADILRQEGFHSVHIATLREDWPEKREQAQSAVREFVANSAADGRTPIVIPYRVHGFGPYSRVLEGLDYVSDERGLVPHPAVVQWIERQVDELRSAKRSDQPAVPLH